jgi:hypothetical protein
MGKLCSLQSEMRRKKSRNHPPKILLMPRKRHQGILSPPSQIQKATRQERSASEHRRVMTNAAKRQRSEVGSSKMTVQQLPINHNQLPKHSLRLRLARWLGHNTPIPAIRPPRRRVTFSICVDLADT